MQKINFNEGMKNILKSIDKNARPVLVLHSCCAPCSSSVIERLTSFFKIIVLYYNPNIYPKEEYEKRKSEQQNFIKTLNSEGKDIKFVELDYDSENYIQQLKGLENEKEGGVRCYHCYKIRMAKTAEYAKEKNADFFCTTLSVSPYKNAQFINEIGQELTKNFNVSFLPSDFKKENGYLRSIELSKQYNFYRQDYCGCIFSKRNFVHE